MKVGLFLYESLTHCVSCAAATSCSNKAARKCELSVHILDLNRVKDPRASADVCWQAMFSIRRRISFRHNTTITSCASVSLQIHCFDLFIRFSYVYFCSSHLSLASLFLTTTPTAWNRTHPFSSSEVVWQNGSITAYHDILTPALPMLD